MKLWVSSTWKLWKCIYVCMKILRMHTWKFLRVHECVKFLSLHILMDEIMRENFEFAYIDAWSSIFGYESAWMNAWNSIFFSFTFCLNEFMNECMRVYFLFLLEWKCMYKCMRFCFSFLNENEIYSSNACKNASDSMKCMRVILIIFGWKCMYKWIKVYETLLFILFFCNVDIQNLKENLR